MLAMCKNLLSSFRGRGDIQNSNKFKQLANFKIPKIQTTCKFSFMLDHTPPPKRNPARTHTYVHVQTGILIVSFLFFFYLCLPTIFLCVYAHVCTYTLHRVYVCKCPYLPFYPMQSVSSRLPKLSQVLDNVRKTAEESGRNLIDDALASLREMDTQRFGDGLSPSPSDTDLPSSLTPGDYPSMLGQLGDLGTDGRKIAIKRYDSSSSVSTSGATTPIKLSAARPFGSVTTPVKERPHLYRASVPNLTEPSAADQSRSPWKLQRSGKHSHSVSVDMGSSK